MLSRSLGKLVPPKLNAYRPYKKQRDFHDAGATKRERLLRAGNQQGKTFAGAAEAAIHATGLYPDDWAGRRFNKPTLGWVGADTGELLRDNPQKLLLGDVGEEGTGLIPNDRLVGFSRGLGVDNLVDTIIVKHTSGRNSRIKLKQYSQGRLKWQSASVDWLWLDEEPPEDIYSEALTRTNATGGLLWITFTPLLGMSGVVRRFLMETSPDRADINMTIEDAEHISAEDRARIIASYPAHERAARINGTPILGSGAIFPIDEETIKCDPVIWENVPTHWREIGGLDFGWQHPTAAVKLLYNPDDDVIIVTNAYKRSQATPIIHAAALRPWGKTLPWAWPQDGLQHDKTSGQQLAKQYEELGMNMLEEHAKFDDDRGNGVEAGISEMLMRMETRKLLVCRHLNDFFDELRLYHRKDGKVVKEFDDVLSACRYAIMCIRESERIKGYGTPTRHREGRTWQSV